MNRQKHKLSRRILAVLLMAAMLITMFPSAMFARPGGGYGNNDNNAYFYVLKPEYSGTLQAAKAGDYYYVGQGKVIDGAEVVFDATGTNVEAQVRSWPTYSVESFKSLGLDDATARALYERVGANQFENVTWYRTVIAPGANGNDGQPAIVGSGDCWHVDGFADPVEETYQVRFYADGEAIATYSENVGTPIADWQIEGATTSANAKENAPSGQHVVWYFDQEFKQPASDEDIITKSGEQGSQDVLNIYGRYEPDVDVEEKINELLGQVTVDCLNTLVEHPDQTYTITEVEPSVGNNGKPYELSEMMKNESGQWTVDVTINPDPYQTAFATTYNGIGHPLNPETQSSVKITLVYGDNGWQVADSDKTKVPITFTVKCTATPDQYITGFEKDVIDENDTSTLPAGIDRGDYTIPENENATVTIPYDGEVTLLYAITVTGKAGTRFTVTDDGTKLVKVDGVSVTRTENEDSVQYTGTIPVGASSVTFYVSKTFTDVNTQGQLVNTATVETTIEGGLVDIPENEDARVEENVPGEKEGKPDAPDNINELLKNATVTVECVTKDVTHNEVAENKANYDFSNYSTGTVIVVDGKDGVFSLEVSIENQEGNYIDEFNTTTGKTHDLDENSPQDYTVTLIYQDRQWSLDEKDDSAHLYVTCPYDLTDIAKTIVTVDQKGAVQQEVNLTDEAMSAYTLPAKENNTVETVTIPYGGSVKLLYAITVKGAEDANFIVTDPDSELVGEYSSVKDGEKEGTYEGTIPEGGTITFYVSREFKADSLTGENNDQLTNTATLAGDRGATVDPDEDTDEETVPGAEAAQTFTLTYDANGGNADSVPIDEKAYTTSDNPVALNTETIPTHDDIGGTPIAFLGWSLEPVTDPFDAGENYGEVVVDNVTFEDEAITVYAVWGYDNNDDGIADAEQIVITPADIVAYTGGTGYTGVLNHNGEEIGTEVNGLPEPGFYFILPYDLNEEFGESADQMVDLSNSLRLSYSNNDGTDVRSWTLKLYNTNEGVGSEDNVANKKYVYSMVAGETNPHPVRLEIRDENGNLVTDDQFDLALNSLYETYEMKLYTDESVDRTEVEAEYSTDGGDTWQDADIKGISRRTATLTIRGTNDTNPVSEIQSNVTEAVTQITATDNDGITYYVNGSQIPVINQESVQLLADSIVGENAETQTTLEKAIVEAANADEDVTITNDYNFDFSYLDLVDSSNGNAYVTMGDGQSMTLYWPYPEGMDQDDTFYIAHFDGLDRNFDGDVAGALADGTVDLNLYHEGDETYKLETTEFGIKFTTSSFSPFALVYDASQADDGDDNPPYYPWYPDGDDDGPSGLNTEDHFSYVVGYAEDYRTGEATDNEDLWPVKPNNQITRAEVATIFYRLLEDEVRDEYDTTTSDFSDVTADSWYNQTVSTLARMGIVKGYEDGSFRPNAPITRAEFGAIATRFFAETGATYVPGTFTDVTGDEWYANAIQDAVNLGLIGGYPDGTVRPNNNITRAEACAIVNRTLGRVPDADHLLPEDVMKVWPDNNPTDWFYADMQEATNGHEYAWIEEDGHEIEEWTNLLDKDWTDR